MNELIKVENKNSEVLVSARELHDRLEIGKDFTTWIDSRVHKNGDVTITSVEVNN